MTTKQLADTARAVPFRPFALHLDDGRTLEVPHPEFIAYVPGGRTAIVLRPDESHGIVDLLLVTDLEVKALSPSASGDPSR